MIAAICTWHHRHSQAASEIEARLRRGERLVSLAPALVETYAVLTRLPAPHRLSPADAWTLIEANFVESCRIVALKGDTHGTVLRELARQAIGGGRTYDAMIAECAQEAKAAALLTFNRRHFDPAPAGVSVVEPGPG